VSASEQLLQLAKDQMEVARAAYDTGYEMGYAAAMAEVKAILDKAPKSTLTQKQAN
jgi:hypothetical protein